MKIIVLIIAMASAIQVQAQDCSKIKKEGDKFRNKITYSTDINFSGISCYGTAYGINVYKVIYMDSINSDTAYYASFYKKESNGSYGTTGLTILFEDGSKYQDLSHEVDTDVTRCSEAVVVKHSIFIKLNSELINKMLINRITDFQVGICEASIKPPKAAMLQAQVKCLISK